MQANFCTGTADAPSAQILKPGEFVPAWESIESPARGHELAGELAGTRHFQ